MSQPPDPCFSKAKYIQGSLIRTRLEICKSLWIIHRWDDVNYENCALQDLFVEKGSICSKLKKSNKLFCVKTQYRAVTLLIQTC